jgi:hypothetical protein
MKIFLLAGIILTLITSSVLAAEKAEICINRGEDHGVLNIRPVQVIANGKEIVSITGGERKCVFVETGRYSIVAQSSDPYDPNDINPKTWQSKPLKVVAHSNIKKEIIIKPISRGAEYVGPWKLIETQNSGNDRTK